MTTATSELAGTSTSAQYGAPHNAGRASVQQLGPLAPLKYASVGNPERATALATYAASDAAAACGDVA